MCCWMHNSRFALDFMFVNAVIVCRRLSNVSISEAVNSLCSYYVKAIQVGKLTRDC